MLLNLGMAGDFIFRIAAFIVVIGVIVLVHELGHFLAARAVGVRVIRFSIGFPPRLLSWKRKDTEYQIGVIPFGGYVKMAGIVDESFDAESAITGAPDEFSSKSPLQKTLILSAGVLMNMLFAWLLAMILVFSQGKPVIDAPVIGGVDPKMPAATALHLQPMDRILSINGIATPKWDTLTSIIHSTFTDTLTFVWLRGKDTLTARTMPLTREINTPDGKKKVGLVGISPYMTYESIGLLEAITTGHRLAWMILRDSFGSFIQLFRGKAAVSDLVGPIGIVQLSGESAKAGLSSFWSFIMLISISVGMLNILPLPVLDGGHIVMVWVEAIRGKPMSTEAKLRFQQVGLVFLLLMILFVSYHDIIRIWGN